MKKSSTRTVLFCLLLAASIGSYIFLNSVSSTATSYEQAADQEEYEEASDAKVILPDIHLVKKVIETGKRLIPAS
ncbi:MAG: hypothetical protein H6558_11755 [Lewinellaceae bacterium]|nr:hypothetical protein [Lewinellaceae bacterium]MCB9288399.1 hypothetical protein [Lewinellaceae bacterium]